MDWENDLDKIMHLCICLIQSGVDRNVAPAHEWKHDAKILGLKLFRHSASARQVAAGVTFGLNNNEHFSHIDHSSVAVIVRSALETYLAFNYIFINKDEQLSSYRHKLWKHSGLIERSKLSASTPEGKEVLFREAILIEELKNEILSNPFFLECNSDARKEIKNGAWRPKGGWYTVTGQTDIHEKYFSNIYNHLSCHSHSSYISALQTRDASTIEDQQMLVRASCQNLCLILAHFLFSYVELFPESRNLLESDASLFNIASKWRIQKKNISFYYDQPSPPV